MILSVRIKNFKAFSEAVELDLTADMRIKKLSSNVTSSCNFNILKSAGIYGANNVGKTCIIDAIRSIKNVLSNNMPFRIVRNIFTDNPVTEMGITFSYAENVFSYDFAFDNDSKKIIFEKFESLKRDKYGNVNAKLIFSRDIIKKRFDSYDETFLNVLPLASGSACLLYLLELENYPFINSIKKSFTDFAESIEIVRVNNIPIEKTISVLKNDMQSRNKVVQFIKNADVELDNVDFIEDNFTGQNDETPNESVLIRKSRMDNLLKLRTYHKGRPVPSVLFDSAGTKKIIAISSYIVEALEQGKILIVDELESSLHFKLSRAIAALFNNELNIRAQLIFTTHDVALLDCKQLFRKEQVWFAEKDAERVYLYSLADFTASQGVRGDTSDIAGLYKKGLLGNLPSPDLIKTMLEETSND